MVWKKPSEELTGFDMELRKMFATLTLMELYYV